VIGVTVKPKITPPILKGIHTIPINSVFIRHGSNNNLLKRKSKKFSKLGDCDQY
jgi:hypothetical protein